MTLLPDAVGRAIAMSVIAAALLGLSGCRSTSSLGRIPGTSWLTGGKEKSSEDAASVASLPPPSAATTPTAQLGPSGNGTPALPGGTASSPSAGNSPAPGIPTGVAAGGSAVPAASNWQANAYPSTSSPEFVLAQPPQIAVQSTAPPSPPNGLPPAMASGAPHVQQGSYSGSLPAAAPPENRTPMTTWDVSPTQAVSSTPPPSAGDSGESIYGGAVDSGLGPPATILQASATTFAHPDPASVPGPGPAAAIPAHAPSGDVAAAIGTASQGSLYTRGSNAGADPQQTRTGRLPPWRPGSTTQLR